MNPLIRLKKMVGSLGRRYGGRPFQVVRGFCYDSLAFARQVHEVTYLWRKKFKPGSQNSEYCAKYYTAGGGHVAKEGIVCICDGTLYHGGPTDRMRGILTTYREARRRGIPFYISWTSPFCLEDYLEPATFDWRIKPEELCRNTDEVFPLIIEDVPNTHSWMRLKAALHNRKPQTHVFTNGDNGIGHYAGLYREVFKPGKALQAEVDKNLEAIGAPYTVFTFRFLQLLGDFKDWLQVTLSPDEADSLIARVDAEFLRLAAEVPAGQRILVTSDSKRYLDHVSGLDPRIYVVPGDVRNVDLLKEKAPDAWMKTFVDQQLIMRASKVYLMRTGRMYKSGFPRFAAEVGGVPFVDHVF